MMSFKLHELKFLLPAEKLLVLYKKATLSQLNQQIRTQGDCSFRQAKWNGKKLNL